MSSPIAYQPAHMGVELFQPAQFINPHDWTHDRAGNVNPVLHGQFATPAGEYFDGYAKPFTVADRCGATMMLNEVTGWLLARACGLPVPEMAFFIPLSLNELPAYSGASPLPAADANGQVLSFVTKSVANTAIRAVFDSRLLVEEQAKWTRCEETITFDEGVANADRHAFNLLRKAAGDFVLIDHGFLLFQAGQPYPLHWSDGFLDQHVGHPFLNKLHQNAYLYLSRTSPSVSAAAFSESEAFALKMAVALRSTLFEIAFWSSKLLPGASARWLQFLYSRTQHTQLSALMAKRFGVLQLQHA